MTMTDIRTNREAGKDKLTNRQTDRPRISDVESFVGQKDRQKDKETD